LGSAAVPLRTGISMIDDFLDTLGVPNENTGGTYGNAKGYFGGAQAMSLPGVGAVATADAASVVVDAAKGDGKKRKRRKKKKKDANSERQLLDTNPFVIDLTNQQNIYPLQDIKNELRGANVTLKFYWDMMPMTALMYMTETPRTGERGWDSIIMPSEYS